MDIQLQRQAVASTTRYGTIVRKSIFLPCWLCFIWSSVPAAEQFDVHTVVDDAWQYVTAPVRWDQSDWLIFGGAVTAVGVSHAFDNQVRGHFAKGSYALLNGKDRNSQRDAIPAALIVGGTFAYAALTANADGRVETYTMLEAAGFSAATTEILKLAAGRGRPNETTRVNKWRAGGSSFPSLHVSAAFAIGTVLAESGNDEYRWIRRIIGYGVGVGTMYARLHDNAHWLSDTIAGAAIGISTASFTMQRRDQRERLDDTGRWSIAPTDQGGAMLSYTVPLH